MEIEWQNIDCKLCVSNCDVINFGIAPIEAEYTFLIKFNDFEREIKKDFLKFQDILLNASELNENGISQVVVYYYGEDCGDYNNDYSNDYFKECNEIILHECNISVSVNENKTPIIC